MFVVLSAYLKPPSEKAHVNNKNSYEISNTIQDHLGGHNMVVSGLDNPI